MYDWRPICLSVLVVICKPSNWSPVKALNKRLVKSHDSYLTERGDWYDLELVQSWVILIIKGHSHSKCIVVVVALRASNLQFWRYYIAFLFSKTKKEARFYRTWLPKVSTRYILSVWITVKVVRATVFGQLVFDVPHYGVADWRFGNGCCSHGLALSFLDLEVE